jgi:hypothetical protein
MCQRGRCSCARSLDRASAARGDLGRSVRRVLHSTSTRGHKCARDQQGTAAGTRSLRGTRDGLCCDNIPRAHGRDGVRPAFARRPPRITRRSRVSGDGRNRARDVKRNARRSRGGTRGEQRPRDKNVCTTCA